MDLGSRRAQRIYCAHESACGLLGRFHGGDSIGSIGLDADRSHSLRRRGLLRSWSQTLAPRQNRGLTSELRAISDPAQPPNHSARRTPTASPALVSHSIMTRNRNAGTRGHAFLVAIQLATVKHCGRYRGPIRLVSLTFANWNLIGGWLRRLATLRQAGTVSAATRGSRRPPRSSQFATATRGRGGSSMSSGTASGPT
jgi:hypothetical protein